MKHLHRPGDFSPSLYDGKPLRELAKSVRVAVRKEFKQMPENIELAFSLDCTTPGRVAQVGGAHESAGPVLIVSNVRPGNLAVSVHPQCVKLWTGTIQSQGGILS